ncbi:hypothetical protein D3C78_1392030 [compost metagenome]
MGEEGLVLVDEAGRLDATAHADAAEGAVAGGDVGAEDVEHADRFEEVLVELRVQPVLLGDEFLQGDHLAVGQVDEGVEVEIVLVVGGHHLRRAFIGVDHQAVELVARRTQDESDVLAIKAVAEFDEEGLPRCGLQGALVEVAQHRAEPVERESLCHL